MRFYRVKYSVKGFHSSTKWEAQIEADDIYKAEEIFKKHHPNYSGFVIFNPDH